MTRLKQAFELVKAGLESDAEGGREDVAFEYPGIICLSRKVAGELVELRYGTVNETVQADIVIDGNISPVSRDTEMDSAAPAEAIASAIELDWYAFWDRDEMGSSIAEDTAEFRCGLDDCLRVFQPFVKASINPLSDDLLEDATDEEVAAIMIHTLKWYGSKDTSKDDRTVLLDRLHNAVSQMSDDHLGDLVEMLEECGTGTGVSAP